MPKSALPLILLAALCAPAQAQEAADPWSGIVLVVRPAAVPEGESAYEMAIAEAEAQEADTAAPAAEDTQAGLVVVVDDGSAQEPPSLFAVLDLGLGSLEEMHGAPAPKKVITPRPVTAQAAMPTKVDLDAGLARLGIASSVSTTAPVSSALDARNGGGSGEIKGRVAYGDDAFNLYGVGKLGAREATGTVSVYEGLIVGGAYSVPLGTAEGERLGARLEVADTNAVSTAIEYRIREDGGESFLSLEHAAASGGGTGTLKAGIARKF
ncbi:hypothetical protein [Ancylobacter terrae]|uniref:hypothetical protein n=1 Tax=Ancylobacter sp. sgz301288 TaxID=3342077 RepID=UPI00385F8B9F